ncbi:hypothetical protein KY334_07365 [Candidatus Woesearchaeota archaeon]|nr:hypothetical protein [Candidatus Woesearchaeota archaeon]
MRYFKAFVAGMILPAIISPILLLFLSFTGSINVIGRLPGLYLGSILWGLWNIIFITTMKKVPINDRNDKIGAYGAVYGLFTVLINSFYFEITSVITQFSDSSIIWFLVFYPLSLFFIWKYIVNALNLIFDVY